MFKINKRSLKLPLLLIIGGLVSLGYLVFLVVQEVDLQQAGSQIRQIVRRDASEPAADESDGETAQDASDTVEVYAFTADETGQTPFSLLLDAEEVEYEEYDFGVFVQSINNQTSDSDHFWALYVNGEFAQEAGDKIELEAGDEVEWRWDEVQSDLFD